VAFVVFAMNRPVELVSGDYYAQSLRHERRITARANAEVLGAAFSCAMSPDGRVLSVRLPPGHGADARGTVTGAVRPPPAARGARRNPAGGRRCSCTTRAAR
jgi:hypothetical protein